MAKAHILLTGGAGYIGSHTYTALIDAGYDVTIFDNFCNAKDSVLDRLGQITQRPVTCVRGDVRQGGDLEALFAENSFDAVVHFAALKAVGESAEKPLDYFQSNLSGLINLLQVMQRHDVKRLVFSSSATIYGEPDVAPTPESEPRRYENPYGFTKVVSEQMLEQLDHLDDSWAIGTLRYFNPVGAHVTAMIGEDPEGIPNNLMPYIAKVATGELQQLSVFGDDYDTPDGTGVRDYIHVSDLARGHVLSLAKLLETGASHTVNLGTGQGYSVLDMVQAYAKASGREIPYKIAPRRPGDVPIYLADAARAKDVLGFETEHSLDDMCASSWAWMQNSSKS